MGHMLNLCATGLGCIGCGAALSGALVAQVRLNGRRADAPIPARGYCSSDAHFDFRCCASLLGQLSGVVVSSTIPSVTGGGSLLFAYLACFSSALLRCARGRGAARHRSIRAGSKLRGVVRGARAPFCAGARRGYESLLLGGWLAPVRSVWLECVSSVSCLGGACRRFFVGFGGFLFFLLILLFCFFRKVGGDWDRLLGAALGRGGADGVMGVRCIF